MATRLLCFTGTKDENIPEKATLIYDVELLELETGHRPTNFFSEIDTDGYDLLSQDEVKFCSFWIKLF